MVGIATIVTLSGIIGLFYLDSNRMGERPSVRLWIPTIWLLSASSRNISEWFTAAPQSAVGAERYLEGNPIDRNFQLFILLFALLVLISRSRKVSLIVQANLPIVCFILYCMLSVLWSDFPGVAFKRWTKLVGDFMMIMIVMSDPAPLAAIRRILFRVGCLLVPLSILFIRYYPDWGRRYTRWEGTMSYTGVTTDKNTLGMLCLIVGLAALWRFVQLLHDPNERRRRGPLIAQATLMTMVVYLILAVNSATSLSCFLLGGCLIVILTYFPAASRTGTLNLLVFLTVAIPFSALFLNVGTGGLVEGLGRNSTLTGRTYLWDAVLRTVSNPLMGTGFESFWLGERVQKIGEITGMMPNEAHNGYLEIYINLGWIGVALLALLIISGYRNILIGFRRDPEIARLRVAYFVAALAYNFSEAAFKMTHPVWILFVWAIAAAPLPQRVKREEPSFAQEAPMARPLVAATEQASLVRSVRLRGI